MGRLLLFLVIALAFTAQAKTTYVHPGQKKAPKTHTAKQSKSKMKARKAPKAPRRAR